MSLSLSVLEHYERIASITERMLAAARDEDWNRVVMLGRTYCESVECLRCAHGRPVRDEAERTSRHDLLVRILENDAHTRDLAMPQLARLGELLGRMKRQQSLLQAYGPPRRP